MIMDSGRTSLRFSCFFFIAISSYALEIGGTQRVWSELSSTHLQNDAELSVTEFYTLGGKEGPFYLVLYVPGVL